MKYLFSDFTLLNGIPRKSGGTLGGVYEALCLALFSPVPLPCLLDSLRGLAAGGYLTVEPTDGVLTSATPLSLTDKGREAITPTGLGKLFNEAKATAKKELAFCDTDRPTHETEADWTVEPSGFDAILRDLYERREVDYPLFEITNLGEGYMKLTVHHPNDDPLHEDDGDATNDPDAAAICYAASVTGTAEQITAGLRDLIDTAYLLITEAPRPRKVAIHGGDGSLLISLANAASEQGQVTFRMTVSRIRFNRHRFLGKRDSDLDYAQCGDPFFVLEMRDALGFCRNGVMTNAVLHPHMLTAEERGKLAVIHKAT